MEQESIVNVETIKQEIEDDRFNYDNIDNEEEVNPYGNININQCHRKNNIASQMEQWSILGNIVNYVQYDKNLEILII